MWIQLKVRWSKGISSFPDFLYHSAGNPSLDFTQLLTLSSLYWAQWQKGTISEAIKTTLCCGLWSCDFNRCFVTVQVLSQKQPKKRTQASLKLLFNGLWVCTLQQCSPCSHHCQKLNKPTNNFWHVVAADSKNKTFSWQQAEKPKEGKLMLCVTIKGIIQHLFVLTTGGKSFSHALCVCGFFSR